MKYVLLRDSHSAGVVFYTGEKIGHDNQPKVTQILSEAKIYDCENAEEMIELIKSDWALSEFIAAPMDDKDLFKARLAGV